MIRKRLRPYQVEARDRALAHPGFALFPEPRTGKTLIAYAVADARKPDRLLIVAPKIAIGEWHAGLKDWVGHDCEIMITTYGLAVSRRPAIIRWLEKASRPGMIVDELHKIKRRGRKQSRAIRVLGRRADWRLGLTGTPISQGLEDAWPYFDYLAPNVFGKWKKFEARYLKMGGFRRWNKWTKRSEPTKIVGYRNKQQFARILAEHSFRVKLGDVTPTKMKLQRVLITGSLDATEAQAYDEIENELETYVTGERIRAPLVITQAMKLHQITGGHIICEPVVKHGRKLAPKVRKLGDSKLALLRAALSAIPPGEKVVVIARFRHEIRAIRRTLEASGRTWHVVSADTPWERTFKTDAVVLQIAQAASIDLSSSRRIIFYSWDYSYINFEQARFRILSYTQTRATYYFLIVRGSIDEVLYETITRKKRLADLVVDRYRRRRACRKSKPKRRKLHLKSEERKWRRK